MKFKVYAENGTSEPGERLLMLTTDSYELAGLVRIYDEFSKEWQHPYFEPAMTIAWKTPGWRKVDHLEEIEPPPSADDRWADLRYPKGRPYP